MNTATTTFDVVGVRRPAMPRGAAIAAALYTGIARWLRTPAYKLTRGEEAAEVREMAYQMQDTDPGFAADLFAAAARHESLDD